MKFTCLILPVNESLGLFENEGIATRSVEVEEVGVGGRELSIRRGRHQVHLLAGQLKENEEFKGERENIEDVRDHIVILRRTFDNC